MKKRYYGPARSGQFLELKTMSDTSGFHSMLIRGANWIGDSVMSIPALRELRRLHPETRLTLLVRPWVRGLFEGQGLVDEILCEPAEGTALWRLFWLRRVGERYEAAVLFPNSFAVALAVFIARIPHRIGYRRDGRGFLLTRKASTRLGHRHQIYSYLDLLYQTGLSPIDYLEDASFRPEIRLQIPTEARHRARHLLESTGVDARKPRVVLNPGAHFGSAKRWFTDRYAELAQRLIDERGAEIVLIGSAGESCLAEEIASLVGHRIHVLTGKTDLPALMAVLSACDLFITNDSGPMHLAASLDVPQIALFGSTDEVATGPFSSKATVIHQHVDCSPCLLRECPIDLRCFARITVEQVFEQASVVLSRQLGGGG